MTKTQIELPEATARAAIGAGLLTSQSLDRLLTNTIRRRQTGQSLLDVVSRIRAESVAPMAEEEINAEIKAVRASRRERSAIAAGGIAGAFLHSRIN